MSHLLILFLKISINKSQEVVVAVEVKKVVSSAEEEAVQAADMDNTMIKLTTSFSLRKAMANKKEVITDKRRLISHMISKAMRVLLLSVASKSLTVEAVSADKKALPVGASNTRRRMPLAVMFQAVLHINRGITVMQRKVVKESTMRKLLIIRVETRVDSVPSRIMKTEVRSLNLATRMTRSLVSIELLRRGSKEVPDARRERSLME